MAKQLSFIIAKGAGEEEELPPGSFSQTLVPLKQVTAVLLDIPTLYHGPLCD